MNSYKAKGDNSLSIITKTYGRSICKFLDFVGILPNLKGYTFLIESILFTIYNYINRRTTDNIYKFIADKFNTTESKVELSIRHSIKTALNSDKIIRLKKIADVSVGNGVLHLTNLQFIAIVSNYFIYSDNENTYLEHTECS